MLNNLSFFVKCTESLSAPTGPNKRISLSKPNWRINGAENVPLSGRVSEAGRQGAQFAHNGDPRDTSTADLDLLKTGRTKGCTRRAGWKTLENFCSLYIRAFQTWWTCVMGSFVACGGMIITLPGLCRYYFLRKYPKHKKSCLYGLLERAIPIY